MLPVHRRGRRWRACVKVVNDSAVVSAASARNAKRGDLMLGGHEMVSVERAFNVSTARARRPARFASGQAGARKECGAAVSL